MDILIQISLICGLGFLLYKLIIAIKNIFVGTKEVIQHSTEFTKIVTKLGKKKINEKINKLRLEYELKKQHEDFIVIQIMIEFNVERNVAKDIYKYYFK